MNETTRWVIGLVLMVAVMLISGLTHLGVSDVLKRVDKLEFHQNIFQDKMSEKVGAICTDVAVLKYHQDERLRREKEKH